MQTPRHRLQLSLRLMVAVCLTVSLAGSGMLAESARADGDPASDVLLSQTLFLPQDAGVPADQQAQLSALLRAAQQHGYQIRVAMIASPADLGSVTELWRQPQNYARFLAQELSLVYRGALLVVMPNGYGLDRLAGPLTAEQAALAGLRAPGPNLASETLTAVQRLAASSGHDLPIPHATTPATRGSADIVSWIALAVGSVLVVLAWTASLRARPARPRRTRPPPS
ncbi:MAG: hypothetical protein ACYDHH_13075 [Solirubrobacteraceae bacterium]